MNESPAVGLSSSLRAAAFKLGRLQTGTPARLDKSTIDFNTLAKQEGDRFPTPFSYLNSDVENAVSFQYSARFFGNVLSHVWRSTIKFHVIKLLQILVLIRL